MRTTLTIEDEIARRLKEIAYRTGKSFKSVVNDSLRAGIFARKGRAGRPTLSHKTRVNGTGGRTVQPRQGLASGGSN